MRYFCVSDVHSHGRILKRDLALSGFDIDDPNHILIVCGDLFDRGDDTMETYEFIKSLSKERRILIRGNHELLYEELLDKRFPEKHDFKNGTVKTFCAIAGMDESRLNAKCWRAEAYEKGESEISRYAGEKLTGYWREIQDKVRKSEVTGFMLDDSEWRWYFEIDEYVFVHAFVPTKMDDRSLSSYFFLGESYDYDPDWRGASGYRFEDATWTYPFRAFEAGGFKEDKTLVTGHCATVLYYAYLDGINEGKEDCPIYDRGGLMGLDANTVNTGRINVFAFEG